MTLTYPEITSLLNSHYLYYHGKTMENARRADLSDIDLTGVRLHGAFMVAVWARRTLFVRADLRGADMSLAKLNQADLRKADLREADLSGADLRDTDLRGANFRGAVLQHADLRGSLVSWDDLRFADLSRARIATGWELLKAAPPNTGLIRIPTPSTTNPR